MASTNSTSKSSLNIGRKADSMNLYTSDSTFVVTGNEKTKRFKSVLNDTYVLGQEYDKEINCQLLSYNDGIIKNSSDIVGVDGLIADKEYTIYGQPDKWIYDYQQKYSNCGVVSCLNVLSMAGKKDIQQKTKEYVEWLSTGKETTKTYTIAGEEKTVTKITYPKPLFTYETEELFTLWAIQNSKNDQLLYEGLYKPTNIENEEVRKFWESLGATSKSYCIHSNNCTEYSKVGDINEEDGATFGYMQKNILEHFGVKVEVDENGELPDLDITLINAIESGSSLTREEDLLNVKGYTDANKIIEDGVIKLDKEGNPLYEEGTPYTRQIDHVKIINNQDTVQKIETFETTVFFKRNIGEITGEGENQKTEYTQYDIIKSSTKTTITTTIDYNNYTITENTKEEKMPYQSDVNESCKDWTRDQIEEHKKEYTQTEDKTTTYCKINSEKYSFCKTLAEAVRDGKGVILNGNALGLIQDSNPTHENKPHAITLTGVMYGPVLQSSANNKENYVNDIVGFYVIDSGGWLPVTENAQFVTPDKLYNFLTNFARNKSQPSYYVEGWLPEEHYDQQPTIFDVPGIDINGDDLSSKIQTDVEYISTKENIRGWADDLNMKGTAKKNVLYGNSGKNKIEGGKGNDFIFGEEGNDRLYGQDDSDTLYGGAGDDYIDCGKGNDIVVTHISDIVSDNELNEIYDYEYYFKDDDGNITNRNTNPVINDQKDTIIAKYGKNSIQFENIDIDSLTFTSQNGDLTIGYSKSKEGIDLASSLVIKNYFNNPSSTIKNLIDVQTYYAPQHDKNGNIIYINNIMQEELKSTTTVHDFVEYFLEKRQIESTTDANEAATITGSQYKDILKGGNYNDTIKGYGNNDIIFGGGGSDDIYGGDGSDLIYGSHGNDKIRGEKGRNKIVYSENNTDYSDGGFSGNDFIYNGKGEDYIEMESVSGNDLTFTKDGNNLVIYYNLDKGDSITIQNYFKLKGNTSVKSIKLSNGTLDLVNGYGLISSNLVMPNKSGTTGTIGYDKLNIGNSGGSANGGLGNDVITGGNGNDTLNGGYGDDKLIGKGGDNTFVFEEVANGYDTISATGTGTNTLLFEDNGLVFNEFGLEGGISNVVSGVNYSYTKSKNDLIINYSTNPENSSTATVKISNFYKSKNDFILKDANDNEINLKTQAYAYLEGKEDKASKITGSKYNDYIVAGEKNDTISAGSGNDIIIAGKGNDKITGGKGNNTIIYNKGDGNDTITLTKGENLDIKLQGFELDDEISFKVSGKNLVIQYDNGDDTKSSITLKNFVSKNVTGADGGVNLYVNDTLFKDLKRDNILPDYTNFTPKKYKYTGTYLSDTIDASDLLGVKKDKGATINGGGGNDVIIGSRYNDTIKGGTGNDTITGGYGVNKLDGGEGDDTYKVFANTEGTSFIENTTIKDTGKIDNDSAIIYETKDNLEIWFNIDRNGNSDYTFNVTKLSNKMESGKAKIQGVENIVINGKTEDINDDYKYDFANAQLKQDVVSFLSTNNYSDVNYVMTKTYNGDRENLLAIFNKNEYWTQVQQP